MPDDDDEEVEEEFVPEEEEEGPMTQGDHLMAGKLRRQRGGAAACASSSTGFELGAAVGSSSASELGAGSALYDPHTVPSAADGVLLDPLEDPYANPSLSRALQQAAASRPCRSIEAPPARRPCGPNTLRHPERAVVRLPSPPRTADSAGSSTESSPLMVPPRPHRPRSRRVAF